MAQVLKLPRMSDTMEEGVIANMKIKVGDVIKPGDVIAEVETDKATMEWESFVGGKVLHVTAKSGDTIPVEGMVAIIGKEGEDFQALLTGAAAKPTVSVDKIVEKIDATSAVATLASNSENVASSVVSNGTADMMGKKMAFAKGGKVKAPWDKPRPKDLPKPKKLAPAAKASAKAAAAAAGRPYPNLVDNMRAAAKRK